jgi:hypothetical protein
MDKPFQRKGGRSNTAVGREFEATGREFTSSSRLQVAIERSSSSFVITAIKGRRASPNTTSERIRT